MSKKQKPEKVPVAPVVERAAAARKRKGIKKKEETPKRKAGGIKPRLVDKWTDKEILDVKEKYFDHLAQGFPITSFHYKCSYKTLKKIIEERPDIFPAEELEMIKSRRYHTMITIGMQQAQGQIERGNAQSWKALMYNMFGWKDKVESKEEMSVEAQFKAAVKSQNAREMTELEEVADTDSEKESGSDLCFD